MNSSINKIVYTCSTESLFLRYEKISKKAIKLGRFLQCSVHIFLVQMAAFEKTIDNLVKPYHKEPSSKDGQYDSIIFPPNIFFWRLEVIARPLFCWQQDSLLLICPGIYLHICQLTPCTQGLFLRGSNKKKEA